MINKGRFALLLLNGTPNGIHKKDSNGMGTETILFGFFLANPKESWQEREMFSRHVPASETEVFRSSISSQDMQVLFMSPLLSMGWVEGAVLVTRGVH